MRGFAAIVMILTHLFNERVTAKHPAEVGAERTPREIVPRAAPTDLVRVFSGKKRQGELPIRVSVEEG